MRQKAACMVIAKSIMLFPGDTFVFLGNKYSYGSLPIGHVLSLQTPAVLFSLVKLASLNFWWLSLMPTSEQVQKIKTDHDHWIFCVKQNFKYLVISIKYCLVS